MKRCPTCDKTFEDSMRFCQVDGTSLVDDTPVFDPYATIVAPAGIPVEPKDTVEPETPAIDPLEAATAIAPFPEVEKPIAEPEEMLEMPEAADPLRTMYISESEIRQSMDAAANDDVQMEVPDAVPAPPPFIESSVPTSPPPPPSPFAPQSSTPIQAPGDNFETAESLGTSPVQSVAVEPPAPPFVEDVAPPMIVNEQPQPHVEAPPPPFPYPQKDSVPDAGQMMTPTSDTGAVQSKGLALASMICGILSCLCCVSILTGPAGVIMGFMARGKAKNDPVNYGGAGLALVGMITGVLGFIGNIIVILYIYIAGILAVKF